MHQRRLKIELLKGRTWRYLRYVHTRHAILHCESIKSVLVVGAGYGMAEVALATEFPHLHLTLTDWAGASHGFQRAKQECTRLGLTNVSFDVLNILAPPPSYRTFDLVVSVEVLEHLVDDFRAALNLNRLSNSWLFNLVPFATQNDNCSLAKRAHAFRKCEHYRVGYDGPSLQALFPGDGITAGCYWTDAGGLLRKRLEALDTTLIEESCDELFDLAAQDLKFAGVIPHAQREALGIWRLSRRVELPYGQI